MSIMIIDDDPEDAFLFCEVIQAVAPHLTCVVSYDYQAAKEMLEELDVAPRIIFLDAYMYPMGGKECLIMLGAMEKLMDTKIIVHSGSLSVAQADEFRVLGADHIMKKSTSRESLQLSIREALAIET